ncbi:GNVR domain-containing protein [Spirosoma koreense]
MDVIEEKRIQSINQEGIEIRLSDIVAFIKANRLKILLGGVAGLIIGALYAFSKPNIYKVEVTVMPELQGRGAGGLGAASVFAGLGLDNTNASDAIRPDLYPNVLESVPFAMDILKQPVYSKKLNATTTLEEFINKTSTASFIDKIFSLLTVNDDEEKKNKGGAYNTQAIELTKQQDGLVKLVQGSVLSAYDRKTGILTITATMTDPIVTASVAQLSLNYLTSYITAYRTDKARKRVVFLANQTREAKQRYQAAEYALSNYRDRNRSIFLNTAKLEEQRLQADYILEQSVYNDLAKQLEQAKIKVQEDTPTFKTLEPPKVPLQKSGPKRTFIMLGCAVAGVFISMAYAITRRLFLR